MSLGTRSQPTEDERRVVEELVCDLPSGRPGDLAFDEPWEIRAFALAVSAHQAGQFDWSQFQGALIASIRAWEKESPSLDDPTWSYYDHWVAALESVLRGQGMLQQDALDDRTRDILATPANRNHHEAHTEPIAVDPAFRG